MPKTKKETVKEETKSKYVEPTKEQWEENNKIWKEMNKCFEYLNKHLQK